VFQALMFPALLRGLWWVIPTRAERWEGAGGGSNHRGVPARELLLVLGVLGAIRLYLWWDGLCRQQAVRAE